MAQTILVVDDDENLRDMVRLYLEREGFRVTEAANGRDALFAARYEKPDLVLLDLMMPEMGGYDFIRNFTQESDAPIIVLTAKLEESDKVVGLELGADDYVTKPFGVQELIARVRAVLRRAGQHSRLPEILRAAEITLDRTGRTVRVSGNVVALTPSEFELLETFMLSPGRAFPASIYWKRSVATPTRAMSVRSTYISGTFARKSNPIRASPVTFRPSTVWGIASSRRQGRCFVLWQLNSLLRFSP